MNDSNYSAFKALKKNEQQGLRIRGKAVVQGTGENAMVMIALPLAEVGQARPGSGQRKSIGFSLGPLEFELPDGQGTVQLYAGWVSLTGR